MTTSPAVEECGHSWTPIAPPEPYPYPDGLICCAFRDRPFEIMPEARCHQASAQALQWPKWEAEHGCVAPPDSGPNHPICCLTMIGDQVTDVKQLPFRMCPSSDQAMPFSWCELYRCIDGPAPANYPDSSLGGLPGDNSVHSPPASSRGSTVLFLCAGAALLLFIIITCCYLSCMITVRACFAPPGRRRAPLSGPPWQRDPLRPTRERSVAPSFRARLAAARRSAAVQAESPDGDSDSAAERRSVYVVMPDQTVCIGEKAPSLTHSDTLKSPSGATDESAAATAGISAAADGGGGPPAQHISTVSAGAPQHSIQVPQREGGVLWSGAPVASRGWVGNHVGGMWPGAFETPVQNVWAVGVVGGHVRGVYPVEIGEPWLGVTSGGGAAWGARDGLAAGSHGVDIELPPLPSGVGDSDTVHDTTVHAPAFQVQHGSPFHCSVQEPQTVLMRDDSPASEPDTETGWSRDLYGEESQPVPLVSRPSGGEWRFEDENAQPCEPAEPGSQGNT